MTLVAGYLQGNAQGLYPSSDSMGFTLVPFPERNILLRQISVFLTPPDKCSQLNTTSFLPYKTKRLIQNVSFYKF